MINVFSRNLSLWLSKRLSVVQFNTEICSAEQNIQVVNSLNLNSYYFFSNKKPKYSPQSFQQPTQSAPLNDFPQDSKLSYMKLTLIKQSGKKSQHKSNKTKISMLLNIKVSFQTKINQTRIQKVQSLEQCNEPSIMIGLNRDQHPPEDNKANSQIERFWNELLHQLQSKLGIFSVQKCEIVSGKTNRRKQLALSITLQNSQQSLTSQALSKQFDSFIRGTIQDHD